MAQETAETAWEGWRREAEGREAIGQASAEGHARYRACLKTASILRNWARVVERGREERRDLAFTLKVHVGRKRLRASRGETAETQARLEQTEEQLREAKEMIEAGNRRLEAEMGLVRSVSPCGLVWGQTMG